MTIEASLRYALRVDPDIDALIGDPENPGTGRLWWSGAIGIEPVPEMPATPWGMLKALPATSHTVVRKGSKAKSRVYQIFWYDLEGSYDRINRLLDHSEDVVRGLAPFHTGEGILCHDAVWEGLSGDLRDDGYRCFVRFGTIRMTTSR